MQLSFVLKNIYVQGNRSIVDSHFLPEDAIIINTM